MADVALPFNFNRSVRLCGLKAFEMKMTAVHMKVGVLVRDGIDLAFGIPGAAIAPWCQTFGGTRIQHIVVQHEEGGAQAAEKGQRYDS